MLSPLCLWVGLSALLSRPFFSLNMGAAQGKGLSVLFGMILDIVPTNLFTPFSRGNTLQILFVAVVAGIAMISISDRTDTVAALMEQLGFIVNSIMGAIGRLVPLFIFGSLFNIVSDNETDVLKNAGKFFFGTVAVCAIMLVVYTAATCVRMRCGPMDLWKKAISTFVIGLTTASSTAALADDLKTCTEGYGVSPKLANFAVPLGQIIFKPGNAVMYFFCRRQRGGKRWRVCFAVVVCHIVHYVHCVVKLHASDNGRLHRQLFHFVRSAWPADGKPACYFGHQRHPELFQNGNKPVRAAVCAGGYG